MNNMKTKTKDENIYLAPSAPRNTTLTIINLIADEFIFKYGRPENYTQERTLKLFQRIATQRTFNISNQTLFKYRNDILERINMLISKSLTPVFDEMAKDKDSWANEDVDTVIQDNTKQEEPTVTIENINTKEIKEMITTIDDIKYQFSLECLKTNLIDLNDIVVTIKDKKYILKINEYVEVVKPTTITIESTGLFNYLKEGEITIRLGKYKGCDIKKLSSIKSNFKSSKFFIEWCKAKIGEADGTAGYKQINHVADTEKDIETLYKCIVHINNKKNKGLLNF